MIPRSGNRFSEKIMLHQWSMIPKSEDTTPSHEQEVVLMQISHRHILQCNRSVYTGCNDDISSILSSVGQESREIGKDVVINLDHVMPGREIPNGVLAESGPEREPVVAVTADQQVAARTTDQPIRTSAPIHSIGAVTADQFVVARA